MVSKSEIDRINELARKAKSAGLTEEEKKEQARLRRKYIDSVKENLRASLDNVEFTDDKEKLN